MPCHHLSIAPLRYLHRITAMLFCLSCAGCIADSTPDPDVSLRRAATEAQVPPAISNADASPNPGVPTASTHRAASSLALLRSESALMFKDGISILAAEDLLQSSRKMSDAINRMTQDAASSPEAQDLTRHYRSSLERAMGQEGVLERFSCGLSICIGIARTRSSADHEAWGHRFASDASSPTYSYAEASEHSWMGYENRFIFSTDPEMSSISGN